LRDPHLLRVLFCSFIIRSFTSRICSHDRKGFAEATSSAGNSGQCRYLVVLVKVREVSGKNCKSPLTQSANGAGKTANYFFEFELFRD